MDIQYEKVCALLTDTIMLMCKNGVQFRNELKVQGLIGLTVDKHVFIIQINEIVKAEEQALMYQKSKNITESPGGHNSTENNSPQGNGSSNDYHKPGCYHREIKMPKSDATQEPKQPVELSKRQMKSYNEVVTFTENMSYGLTSPHYYNDEQRNEEPNSVDMESSTYLDSSVLHPGLDPGFEQNSPIDLHIGSRLFERRDEHPAEEPPDIKPFAGNINDWTLNPLSLHQNEGLEVCKKGRAHEIKKSEILDLKTNQSFDPSHSSFQPTALRYNEKKRPVSDDYDYDECEVSKFSCNLCPAAYKHYCNLLTHEVKVHGRQKKKGGRRKKLV